MRLLSSAFVVAVIAFVPLSADAKKITYTVASSVPFAQDSGVRENIKQECKLQTRLPEAIKKEAKRGVKVMLTDEPLENVAGKVLSLEFTNVFGLGGGGFSGSKSATVRGVLKEDGEVIGTVTARRRTLFRMKTGTCSLLKRVVEKIGEDVADWLREPTMDARLGDIKDEDEDE